ncbi:hypothetical protein [Microseira wollei]|uniref:hypothetical protein n=1 Tax=Microseira wollei TaxID=467598 RepID=UPI001CFDD73F|nr:hypothetical protein [Microseira wollei]
MKLYKDLGDASARTHWGNRLPERPRNRGIAYRHQSSRQVDRRRALGIHSPGCPQASLGLGKINEILQNLDGIFIDFFPKYVVMFSG